MVPRNSMGLRPSYRWFVLASAFTAFIFSNGVRLTYPNFFVALIEEFHWSRALTASVFSISLGIAGFTAPLVGLLVDRLGPRRVILPGAVLAGASLVAAGAVNQFWQFFLFYAVLATLGEAALGVIPQTVVLAHWFKRHRGTIIGIAYSGIGVGVLLLSPASERLIAHLGWRAAYLTLGLLLLGIVLPLTWYGARVPTTADRGSGKEETGTNGAKAVSVAAIADLSFPKEESLPFGWTLRQAMRTIPFWCLFLIFTFMPVGVMGVLAHQVPYLVDIGFSRATAASILGLAGITSSAGRIFFGTIADRIGHVNSASLSYALTVAGILALMGLDASPVLWLLYLHAVLFGISYGARGPIIASLTSNLYPGSHFGSIYGFISVGFGIGGTVGPWLYGYIYDTTGSYRLAFQIAIAAMVAAASLFWVIKLTYRRFPQSDPERFRI